MASGEMNLLSTLRVPGWHHLDPPQSVGSGCGRCPPGLGAGLRGGSGHLTKFSSWLQRQACQMQHVLGL